MSREGFDTVDFSTSENKGKVIRTCQECHRTTHILVDVEKHLRWTKGELIQNVWPELNLNQRELLITGTHAECWEKMFPDEEEGGDPEEAAF